MEIRRLLSKAMIFGLTLTSLMQGCYLWAPLLPRAGKAGGASSDIYRDGEQCDREPVYPPWYDKIDARDPLILVGFGYGASAEEAKSRALGDIGEQIEVKVESAFMGETTSVSGAIEERLRERIAVTSEVNLRDARRIRQGRDECGYHYMAYEADLRPKEQIVVERLLEKWGGRRPRDLRWQGPRILVESTFMKTVEQQLNASARQSGTRTITVELRRDEHIAGWVLIVAGVATWLRESDLSRLIRWKSTVGDKFVFRARQPEGSSSVSSLHEGEPFLFIVEAGNAQGYFTLFNLYPDGRVCMLQQSRRLAVYQEIPDRTRQREGEVFVAHTAQPGQASHDTYLVLRSAEPLDTSCFRSLPASGVVSGEDSYKLDRFLAWLDGAPVEAIAVLCMDVQPEIR